MFVSQPFSIDSLIAGGENSSSFVQSHMKTSNEAAREQPEPVDWVLTNPLTAKLNCPSNALCVESRSYCICSLGVRLTQLITQSWQIMEEESPKPSSQSANRPPVIRKKISNHRSNNCIADAVTLSGRGEGNITGDLGSMELKLSLPELC